MPPPSLKKNYIFVAGWWSGHLSVLLECQAGLSTHKTKIHLVGVGYHAPNLLPKQKWKVAPHHPLKQYDHAITKRSVNRGHPPSTQPSTHAKAEGGHPTIHPQLHKFGGGLPSTISTAAAYLSLKRLSLSIVHKDFL